MPIKATKRQKEIFNRLTQYFITKGYEYYGYTGINDDSHKFGDGSRIICYVKFISINARVYPKESIMVAVKTNGRNKSIKEFENGNGKDFYGIDSKRVFIIFGNQKSYDKALRLIDTI
ncbi:MAG: hypothetical protein KJ674_05545 [Nanoarchaeota archaeon]|nr:hypothetical protein [Nanoarchaeota archaeon]